jgi:hypothetical protein
LGLFNPGRPAFQFCDFRVDTLNDPFFFSPTFHVTLFYFLGGFFNFKHFSHLFLFAFPLAGLGFELRALHLAKLSLYGLIHTSSAFCSGHFGDGGFMNYSPGLAWNGDPLDLSLPSSWDHRHEPLVPALHLFF